MGVNVGGVPLRRRLASFHRRRIAIPVDDDALVLDVGSGDKPHWRADVLLDRYVGPEHGGQRSSAPAASVHRPLFDADAADMPFADRSFDYVICSHVLEHVPDPAAVVAELSRVGRAGYIEVPEAASAKILDFPSHLWWCRLEGSTLVFTAKQQRAFDADIGAFIERAGLERRLARLLDADFDLRVISLRWRDRVDVRVEGRLDPTFAAAASLADVHHSLGGGAAGRLLTTVLTAPGRRRRRAIRLDDIVKPELRTGGAEVLGRRVYRLPTSAS